MNFWSLVAMTVGPGFAIAIFVYWKDRFDREPIFGLVKCFFWGLVSTGLAVYVSLKLSDVFPSNVLSAWDTFLFTFIAVAGSEEGAKMFFLLAFPFRKSYFDEPYDGITYSVMISMGFATLENILYVFSQSTPAESFSMALTRMFTAVPAHATFAIAMGYFTGLAKFSRNYSIPLILAGLLSAVIMHGAYDFFLMQREIEGITSGAFVSLIISVWLSWKAIKLHQRISPFRTGA